MNAYLDQRPGYPRIMSEWPPVTPSAALTLSPKSRAARPRVSTSSSSGGAIIVYSDDSQH